MANGSIFQYDALDILDRADKSASDWWSNTLANAKKRTDMDQALFENAFKNDKTYQTHASDVFKTGAENVYKGVQASNNTMLEPDRYNWNKAVYGRDTLSADDQAWQYQNAMSPENRAARLKVQAAKFQDPAAMLDAGVAASQFADQNQSAQAGMAAAGQWSGALGTRAIYGNASTDAQSLNLSNDIVTGNLQRANAGLKSAGLGYSLRPAPGGGDNVVVIDAQGKQSMPVSRSAAAAMFNDRTGIKQGQAGAYTAKWDDDQRENNQAVARDDARFAQQQQTNESRAAMAQQRMSSTEYVNMLRFLAGRVDKAESPEDREQAQRDLFEFQNERGQQGGAPVYTPQGDGQPPAAGGQPIRQTWMGAAPTAPVASAAPAAAAPQSRAPAAPYQPPAAQKAAQAPAAPAAPSFKPGEVTEARLSEFEQAYESAQARLQQVQTDWARATSVVGGRGVTDATREKIKQALDAAQAEVAKAKAQRLSAIRANRKDQADAAYNPYKDREEARQKNIGDVLTKKYGE